MATRPCIDCGTLRKVGANSRPEILCQPCRRARRGITGEHVRGHAPPPRPCVDCGQDRIVTKLSRLDVVCQPCRRVRRLALGGDTEAEAIRRRERRSRLGSRRDRGHHRKRAVQFGVAYEPINPKRVYDRDRWVCGICGERVDPSQKWPNQMCASLDHVVPMSLGGGHLYVNVQCAHWICNVIKSNRGAGDQLALIG